MSCLIINLNKLVCATETCCMQFFYYGIKILLYEHSRSQSFPGKLLPLLSLDYKRYEVYKAIKLRFTPETLLLY